MGKGEQGGFNRPELRVFPWRGAAHITLQQPASDARQTHPQLAIGIAQAAALAPGLSRSGLTLTMALFLGLRRDTAARFVFLMSLPAVLAVAVKEVIELRDVGLAGLPVTILAVGLVTAALVGYITVKYFVRYLASHSLDVFAYYRFGLAAVAFVWLWTR